MNHEPFLRTETCVTKTVWVYSRNDFYFACFLCLCSSHKSVPSTSSERLASSEARPPVFLIAWASPSQSLAARSSSDQWNIVEITSNFFRIFYFNELLLVFIYIVIMCIEKRSYDCDIVVVFCYCTSMFAKDLRWQKKKDKQSTTTNKGKINTV